MLSLSVMTSPSNFSHLKTNPTKDCGDEGVQTNIEVRVALLLPGSLFITKLCC